MYVAIKTLVVRNTKKSPDTDVSVFTGSRFSGRLGRLGVLGQVSVGSVSGGVGPPGSHGWWEIVPGFLMAPELLLLPCALTTGWLRKGGRDPCLDPADSHPEVGGVMLGAQSQQRSRRPPQRARSLLALWVACPVARGPLRKQRERTPPPAPFQP